MPRSPEYVIPPNIDAVPAGDLIGLYKRQMYTAPLLTRAEEKALGKKIAEGRSAKEHLSTCDDLGVIEELEETIRIGLEARDLFCRANTRLVWSVAKKYQNMGVPFLDLLQEGNAALLHAVDKYDYTKDNKFSSYATRWIWTSVYEAVMKEPKSGYRPSRRLIEKIKLVDKAIKKLTQDFGRDPSDEEIAQETNLSLEQIVTVKLAKTPVVSLEGLNQGSNYREDRTDEQIADIYTVNPERYAENHMRVERMKQIICTILSTREVEAVMMSYGLDGKGEFSQVEISEIVGVSRQRINTALSSALGKLRQHAEFADFLEDVD